jgi:AraC-like DNA-binding protein
MRTQNLARVLDQLREVSVGGLPHPPAAPWRLEGPHIHRLGQARRPFPKRGRCSPSVWKAEQSGLGIRPWPGAIEPIRIGQVSSPRPGGLTYAGSSLKYSISTFRGRKLSDVIAFRESIHTVRKTLRLSVHVENNTGPGGHAGARAPSSIRFEVLAENLGMSPRNFIRRFKAATGLKPVEYLQKLRVRAARHYLEEGDARVEEIGDRSATTMLPSSDVSSSAKLDSPLRPIASALLSARVRGDRDDAPVSRRALSGSTSRNVIFTVGVAKEAARSSMQAGDPAAQTTRGDRSTRPRA